jgi:hypothetical protein
MSTGSSPHPITPIAASLAPAEPFEQFSDRIRREFIEGSAIAPVLFATTVRLVTDTEPQPGGEVSYPIHEALGWHLSRFGLQARAALYAALLLQEDGSVWQAKLNRARHDREKGKEIKYEYPVGAPVRAFLPSVPTEIRQAIAEHYGVEVPGAGPFWNWLYEHPEITVVLTEGYGVTTTVTGGDNYNFRTRVIVISLASITNTALKPLSGKALRHQNRI